MPQSTDPIQLYYWPTPNGWKISIMLEECGLPYDVRLVNIGRGEQFTPEFLAIAPNNRIPAITDPEWARRQADLDLQVRGDPAISLAQDRALRRRERTRAGSGRGMAVLAGRRPGPMAGQANHFRNYAPEKIAYGVDRYTNEVNRLFGVMNRTPGDATVLAGR